ncbi:MAG: MFS transporter [Candidatus Odinarchaeota archaeon]|nr:MFS transporter [Candidatus Odinarchaeota archaeon]
MGIFASISSAAFNSWMRELIPKNIRGRYFAKRVRISIAVGSVLSIIAAMYVDGVQRMSALVSEHPPWASSASAPSGFMGSKSSVSTPFRVTPQAPHRSVLSHRNVLSVLYSHHIRTLLQYSQVLTNYLTVSEGVITIYDTNIILKYSSIFVAAFVFGLMGIIFLSLVPEPKMKDNEHFNIKNIAKPFKDKRFKRLIMFIFVWSFACSLVTPFFVVYMLIRLGLPLSFVIGVTALSQIITVLLLPIWGNLIDKFGIKPVMRLGAIFYLIAIALWPKETVLFDENL